MLWDPRRVYQSVEAPCAEQAVTRHPPFVEAARSGIPDQHILLGDRVPTRPQRLHFPGAIGIAPRQIRIPEAIRSTVLKGPLCSLTNAREMASERRRILAVVVRSPGFLLLVQIRQVALVAGMIVHVGCLSEGLGQPHHMHSVAMDDKGTAH